MYYFPILTYGAHTWTAAKRDVSRLQAERSFYEAVRTTDV